MFAPKKLCVTTLLALLAVVFCKSQDVEVADIERNIMDANPAEMAVLTQLKMARSGSGDAIYTYKCTVGTYSSNRLACAARDTTSWPSPQNVQLTLHCPKTGSGLTLSYVEIIYSVSSPSVNCFVNEGAVGLGYIGVTINAWNTLLFSYSANFYTY